MILVKIEQKLQILSIDFMVTPTAYLLGCEVGTNGLKFLKKRTLLSKLTKQGLFRLVKRRADEYCFRWILRCSEIVSQIQAYYRETPRYNSLRCAWHKIIGENMAWPVFRIRTSLISIGSGSSNYLNADPDSGLVTTKITLFSNFYFSVLQGEVKCIFNRKNSKHIYIGTKAFL